MQRQHQTTRQYKLNTTVSTVPTTGIHRVSPDEQGLIPQQLANLTLGLLQIHSANGDLAWVIDMASDMEREEINGKRELIELLGHLRPDMIDGLLEQDTLSAELKLTLTELRADLG